MGLSIMRRFGLCAVAVLALASVVLAASAVPVDGDLSLESLSSLHSAGTSEGELQSLLWQLEQAEAAHDETDAMLMQITEASETEDQSASAVDDAEAAEDELEMAEQEEEDHAELLETSLHSTALARQHITDWGVTGGAALAFTPGWFDVLQRGENNDYCRMVSTHERISATQSAACWDL